MIYNVLIFQPIFSLKLYLFIFNLYRKLLLHYIKEIIFSGPHSRMFARNRIVDSSQYLCSSHVNYTNRRPGRYYLTTQLQQTPLIKLLLILLSLLLSHHNHLYHYYLLVWAHLVIITFFFLFNSAQNSIIHILLF